MSNDLKPTIRITRKCLWRFPPTSDDLTNFTVAGKESQKPLGEDRFGGIYVDPEELGEV